MEVLFATSEALPLIKTGGLADVAGSLPRALTTLGQDVRLILPAYPDAVEQAGDVKPVTSLSIPGASEPVRILKGLLPDSHVTLYLVDSAPHFDRDGNPYTGPDGHDWPDNAARFTVFSQAIAAVAQGQADGGWKPDVVHCNDWQTGLACALLAQKTTRPATVFTIHNLAYQGLFPWDTFSALGLPEKLWSVDAMEFHDHFSFVKGGLVYADRITTVSPGYAQEICTPALGHGLDGLLRFRAKDLVGILNGADYEVWDPATDPALACNYDRKSVQRKSGNKTALQEHFGLSTEPGTLLFGYVGRLVEQKGVDLILAALDGLADENLQMIILGTGSRTLEEALRAAARKHPGKLAVHIGYNEELAHRIEAGVDSFLMPSRFEPCGLNQIYSLRYGTVPVVRRTGGLGDTVVDMDEGPNGRLASNGVVFDEATPEALLQAMRRAMSCYYRDRVRWWKLVLAGMHQDFSWDRSARDYLRLYQDLCRKPGPVASPRQAAEI